MKKYSVEEIDRLRLLVSVKRSWQSLAERYAQELSCEEELRTLMMRGALPRELEKYLVKLNNKKDIGLCPGCSSPLVLFCYDNGLKYAECTVCNYGGAFNPEILIKAKGR